MVRTDLRRRNGSTLALTLMLLLVMSILAVAVLTVAAGESALVNADIRQTQSYYIARSVTETTASMIAAKTSDTEVFNAIVPTAEGYVNKHSASSTLDGHPYTVEVWRDGQDAQHRNVIRVRTTATTPGVVKSGTTVQYSGTAEKVLYEVYSGFMQSAIYARESLSDSGNGPGKSRTVNGLIIYEQTNTASFVDPNKDPNIPTKNWFQVPFSKIYQPSGSKYKTIYTTDQTWTGNVQLSGSVLFQDLSDNHVNLTIAGTTNLTFDASLNNKTVILAIDDFTMVNGSQLNIDARGLDRLYIYVNGDISLFQNKFDINVLSIESGSSRPPCVFISINSANTFEISGMHNIEAYLYAPFSTFNLSGGASASDGLYIKGSIIGNSVHFNGTTKIEYVANANIFGNQYAQFSMTNYSPHMILASDWVDPH